MSNKPYLQQSLHRVRIVGSIQQREQHGVQFMERLSAKNISAGPDNASIPNRTRKWNPTLQDRYDETLSEVF